ncbi:AbrB/MazE/SpoVT family DNA-binding domain-containing protein [Crossiella cryophila]|uniref:SpoVT-AbrB domain-containing protein n=1 Tax=Crossiella cryophila TaxID=43355 RepID=A0A7W7CE43_9PSEU|nr:AbrB/MazE/SpoVT family DNA-binding domain-containing protein [Crossiella cryophila]MBB4679469.1 hypothetical protein [Crossiella cryophila]
MTARTAYGRARQSGLPVAHLITPPRIQAPWCTVTSLDAGGRLADRAPLQHLEWPPETAVALTPVQGLMIVVTRQHGSTLAITRQGHLWLPASIRRACHLATGARLLVAVYPDLGLLAAYTPAALGEMLLAYHTALPTRAD